MVDPSRFHSYSSKQAASNSYPQPAMYDTSTSSNAESSWSTNSMGLSKARKGGRGHSYGGNSQGSSHYYSATSRHGSEPQQQEHQQHLDSSLLSANTQLARNTIAQTGDAYAYENASFARAMSEPGASSVSSDQERFAAYVHRFSRLERQRKDRLGRKLQADRDADLRNQRDHPSSQDSQSSSRVSDRVRQFNYSNDGRPGNSPNISISSPNTSMDYGPSLEERQRRQSQGNRRQHSVPSPTSSFRSKHNQSPAVVESPGSMQPSMAQHSSIETPPSATVQTLKQQLWDANENLQIPGRPLSTAARKSNPAPRVVNPNAIARTRSRSMSPSRFQSKYYDAALQARMKGKLRTIPHLNRDELEEAANDMVVQHQQQRSLPRLRINTEPESPMSTSQRELFDEEFNMKPVRPASTSNQARGRQRQVIQRDRISSYGSRSVSLDRYSAAGMDRDRAYVGRAPSFESGNLQQQRRSPSLHQHPMYNNNGSGSNASYHASHRTPTPESFGSRERNYPRAQHGGGIDNFSSNPSFSDAQHSSDKEESFSDLISRLQAVNRSDPKAALAQIDSILSSSSPRGPPGSSYGGSQVFEEKKLEDSEPAEHYSERAGQSFREEPPVFENQYHHQEQQDHGEQYDDETDDDETTVSSITNPTFTGKGHSTSEKVQVTLSMDQNSSSNEQMRSARSFGGEGGASQSQNNPFGTQPSTSSFRRPRPSNLQSYSQPVEPQKQQLSKSQRRRDLVAQNPPPETIRVASSDSGSQNHRRNPSQETSSSLQFEKNSIVESPQRDPRKDGVVAPSSAPVPQKGYNPFMDDDEDNGPSAFNQTNPFDDPSPPAKSTNPFDSSPVRGRNPFDDSSEEPDFHRGQREVPQFSPEPDALAQKIHAWDELSNGGSRTPVNDFGGERQPSRSNQKYREKAPSVATAVPTGLPPLPKSSTSANRKPHPWDNSIPARRQKVYTKDTSMDDAVGVEALQETNAGSSSPSPSFDNESHEVSLGGSFMPTRSSPAANEWKSAAKGATKSRTTNRAADTFDAGWSALPSSSVFPGDDVTPKATKPKSPVADPTQLSSHNPFDEWPSPEEDRHSPSQPLVPKHTEPSSRPGNVSRYDGHAGEFEGGVEVPLQDEMNPRFGRGDGEGAAKKRRNRFFGAFKRSRSKDKKSARSAPGTPERSYTKSTRPEPLLPTRKVPEFPISDQRHPSDGPGNLSRSRSSSLERYRSANMAKKFSRVMRLYEDER